MGSYKTYSEMNVWIKSREMASFIYSLTRKLPKEETFGLFSQMRRSAVSIPSNIAEGLGRQHPNDALHFFFIARGSLYELETQLYICHDQKFIDHEDLTIAMSHFSDVRKLLSGLIKYFKTLRSGRK